MNRSVVRTHPPARADVDPCTSDDNLIKQILCWLNPQKLDRFSNEKKCFNILKQASFLSNILNVLIKLTPDPRRPSPSPRTSRAWRRRTRTRGIATRVSSNKRPEKTKDIVDLLYFFINCELLRTRKKSNNCDSLSMPQTVCFTDLGKVNFLMVVWLISSSSQFSILRKLPQKNEARFKSGQNWLKIIISLSWSKSVKLQSVSPI